jgi:hypothetical protein
MVTVSTDHPHWRMSLPQNSNPQVGFRRILSMAIPPQAFRLILNLSSLDGVKVVERDGWKELQ